MNDTVQLEEIAERVKSLPTLPTVYLKVSELMNDPNSSALEIGRVVAHDQALTARLLKVVNSSFYGFKTRIGTVPRAMMMVGFRGLKDMILALSALPALRVNSRHAMFDDRMFWTHSIGSAACARAAATMLGYSDPEEVFTAGLLHDIGKLAEYWFMPEEFVAMLAEAHERNVPVHAVEMERLGFTHADVGDMLARKWHFPERLTRAIACHHCPPGAGTPARETAIVHVADIISRAKGLGDPYDQRVPPLDMAAWKQTGLEKNRIERLMQTTDEEYEKGRTLIAIIMEN